MSWTMQRSSGIRLLVETTMTPLSQRPPNKRFRIVASATSVTWHASRMRPSGSSHPLGHSLPLLDIPSVHPSIAASLARLTLQPPCQVDRCFRGGSGGGSGLEALSHESVYVSSDALERY
eukprot:scaffold1402_cov403-Prasinococcus_capsulatus_cf.AAC.13